jgi:hypothetical protein
VRIDRAVLDLSALAAWLGIVPLEPPDVGTAVAADATLLDLADLLRTYHNHRVVDVNSDLLAVSLVVDRWEVISRYATELVGMACRHSELGIADLASLAVAKANKLPLITGVADLAGVDPDIAVVVLPRQSAKP